jgi:hypothetical protein
VERVCHRDYGQEGEMGCFMVDLWIGNNARSSVVYRSAETAGRVVGGLEDGSRRTQELRCEIECVSKVYVGVGIRYCQMNNTAVHMLKM